MRTTDLKDLLETVQKIRGELHPDLSAPFLEAIVRAEEQHPEDDDGALRQIEAALSATLADEGAE